MHIVIMAGMLPGVEFARKRRLRQCNISGFESSTHLGINSKARNILSKEVHGWSLGSIAREAKERLDEKFKNHRESMIKRHNSSDHIDKQIKSSNCEEGQRIASKLQQEVYNNCSKKGMRKLMRWSKLGTWNWKASDHDHHDHHHHHHDHDHDLDGRNSDQIHECTVCLEEFKTGEVLVHLPCSHRFHLSCVVPWLQNNSHCPVCRTTVTVSAAT